MNIANNIPIKLDNARVWRPFLGGSLLDFLHGMENGADNHFPEEWIMSIVSARNSGREHIEDEGLSKLDIDNTITLKSVINDDPVGYLGKEHELRFHNQPGVLVKLIDSATRLKIQVHPDKEKAREYFDSDFGKTECWHILGGRIIAGEAPCVYLGFKEGVTKEYWKELFFKQDIQGMLNCLHRFEVNRGDTILIKGGVPHAIGAGCFLVEIQEPTDYTIRVERNVSSGGNLDDFMCHQGIGFDKMFDCFGYDGLSKEETFRRGFIQPKLLKKDENGSITSLVGYENTDCFQMNQLEIVDEMSIKTNNSFFGLYIIDGAGDLLTNNTKIPTTKGDQFFVPANTNGFVLKNIGTSPLKAFQFFGPEIR